jgi:hypothetical protein
MKTYWDFSVKERSEMSEDDVSKLLDLELMSKGVMKVEAPQLRKVEDVKVKQEEWFEVNGVFFKTMEQAGQFLQLLPHRSNYEYALGYDYKHAEPIVEEVKLVKLYNSQSLMNAATLVKKNKEAKEYNEKVSSKWNNDRKKMDDTLSEVWNDWRSCLSTKERHESVRGTYEEYLRMCEGNVELAEQFLLKVYSQEDVEETKKWFYDGEEVSSEN